ncbi:MAG: hypothetical protein RBR22_08945 [Desulfuromonas sp.]|nr:hypothetical protein [Desulfuromonas sp.]
MRQLVVTAIATVAMVLLALAPVWAINANLDLSLGYNDNVDETSAQQSSAFTIYSFAVEQPIYTSANYSITGYASTYYRDHLRLGDQWQATAGLAAWQRLLNGRLHATLFAELSRYADHIDIDDERDFIALGSSWQWFFNEKLSTTFALSYEDSRYRNKIERSTTGAQQNSNNRGQAGSTTSRSSMQRDDTMWLLSTTLNYRFSADTETGLTISYRDNDSTLRVESYTETGLESHWRYRLAKQWRLELWGSHLWQEYRYGQERNWLAATRLNWQATDALTLYIQLDKQWHTAPRNADCYTETVSQCGVSWSY